MIAIFIFITGLIIGSFLNVCIFRIPKGQSISFPPSHCMSCGNRIKPYDLIPVISYIILKGKCRYCKEKISVRYPLVELITGLLFLAVYIKFNIGFELIKYFFLISLMIVIGMIDFDTTDVYSKTTWTGIVGGIIFIILSYIFLHKSIVECLQFLYGGLLAGGVIAIIIIITKGMGWGDFEICLLSGLYLGFKQSIVMLLISFITGGICGIFLIISKKKTRKDYIPFGPYIAFSCIITIFFGQAIINWYLNILNI